MKMRPSSTMLGTMLMLLPTFAAEAEPVQITIEGTPIIQLTEPIQVPPSDAAPKKWEYRMYPDQSGPTAALECEPQASHFVDEVRRAGKQRWELVNFVNVVAVDDDDEACLFAIFKRPGK